MDTTEEEAKPTPAYESARKHYTDQFIESLAKDYNFDPTDIEVLGRLYEIEYRYNTGQSFEGEADENREERQRHKKLLKTFRAFRKELEENGGDHFNLEVHHGARMCGDLNPNLDPEDYPGQDFSKNYCYWFEFERYLTFFGLGLEATIERNRSHGGRPKNGGLSLAINYISDFWHFNLGKKYTLDYEGGTGLSEAFIFTKRLIDPLDEVPEVQIVTAMRHWIKQTNEWDRQISKGPSFD